MGELVGELKDSWLSSDVCPKSMALIRILLHACVISNNQKLENEIRYLNDLMRQDNTIPFRLEAKGHWEMF